MSEIEKLLKELSVHIERHGTGLNYMECPTQDNKRFQILTPEGKRKLDGDTLFGYIKTKELQENNETLAKELADTKIELIRAGKEKAILKGDIIEVCSILKGYLNLKKYDFEMLNKMASGFLQQNRDYYLEELSEIK